MKRIYLLSSERSGSNLVRRIINRSAEISGPPAPQLLKAFGPYWSLIEPNGENREKIAHLAVSLLYDHPSPWDHKIETDDLIAHLDSKGWDFERICDYCYSEYARQDGKTGYMPKENYAFDYAFQLANRFPDALFVYLVRDPRDFALSYKNAPGGPKVAWMAAKQWQSDQQKSLIFRDAYPDRTYTIRYEDLVTDAEEEVQKMFEFLDLPYNSRVLNPDESSSETAEKSQYWDNLSKPIMTDNTNKFVKGLKKKEIQHIESVCRPIMLKLGYELFHANEPKSPGRLEQLWLFGKDRVLQRILYRKRMVGSDEYQVRMKRAQIYREIKKIAGYN